MSNALERFDSVLDVRMSWTVILLVLNGVPFEGFRCPSLVHDIRIGRQFLSLKYIPPDSAYDAESTMFLIVWHRTLTRPFCLLLSFRPKW